MWKSLQLWCVFTPAFYIYTSQEAWKEVVSTPNLTLSCNTELTIHKLLFLPFVFNTAEEGQRTTAGYDGSSEILWTQTCSTACKNLPQLFPSIKINSVLLLVTPTFCWLNCFVFCSFFLQVNLVSNASFSQATLPKGPPPMSISQSATAPSTPLTPLSESPSVLTPNSMFTGTPVRRRYSRSVSQGNCEITSHSF